MKLLQLSVASVSRLVAVCCAPVRRWCAFHQVLAATILLGAGIAFAAPGNLDPSFSGNGLVSLKVANFGAFAAAVVQQPDGKLVLGGTGHLHPGDFMAVRVARNGAPDAAFGTSGVASADFEGGDDYAFAMIQQPDGKLVLAGQVETSNHALDIGLVRFNDNGTVDPTFGTNGWATLDIDGSHDYARALIQQPDGKLVIAGEGINSSTRYYQPVFARFNTNGTLDTTFGVGGTTRVNFGNGLRSGAQALAQQPDGNLVAVGTVYDGATRIDFAVMRVTADGALDPTFDGDGMLVLDFNGNFEHAGSVAIQPGGAILVGGLSALPDDRYASAALLRVNGQGRPDNSFGTAGQAVVDLGDYSELNSIVVQDDGRIVATGRRSRTSDASEDMIVARFNANGTLDRTHGNAGVATADFGARDISPSSRGAALVRQADGRYVAVGSGSAAAFTVEFFAAARFDDGAAFPGLIGLTRTSQPVDETAESVTYTVRRTGGTTGRVSVDYATVGGGAQAGSDFEAAGGTLSWGDGDATEKTITVNVIDDALEEADEDFLMTLSAPTGGAQLAASKATTSIASDDGPGELGFLQATELASVIEDFFGEDIGFRVDVRRTSGWSGAVSVDYQTVDGTAKAGTDFVVKSGRLTWAHGDRGVKTIRFTIRADSLREGDEDFEIRLSNPTGGATIPVRDGIKRVRIRDNDGAIGGPGVLSVAKSVVSVAEGDQEAVVTVSRTGGQSGSVSVAFQTVAGGPIPGTAGQDYTGVADRLTWGDGDASNKSIRVPIQNDGSPEANETFVVQLSNPSGATLGSNSIAIVTIVDDDSMPNGAPVISGKPAGTVVAGSAYEFQPTVSDADGDTLTFSIQNRPLWASFNSETGRLWGTPNDAMAGSYGNIVLSVSDGVASVSLAPFSIVVSSSGGPGDLDLTWPLTLDDAHQVPEGIGVIEVFVRRLNGSTGEVSVQYHTNGGSATAGTDFGATSGTLTWANGDMSSKSIEIEFLDDSVDEEMERFDIQISSPSGGATISRDRQNVFIVDNDAPGTPPPPQSTSTRSGGGQFGFLSLLLLGTARLLRRTS